MLTALKEQKQSAKYTLKQKIVLILRNAQKFMIKSNRDSFVIQLSVIIIDDLAAW